MNEYDYKEGADTYDSEFREYNCYAHDILFGMSYEYLKQGEKILDLGIGTGVASIHFSKIGLKVYGLDSSEEMLQVCKSKSFTEELRFHNLLADKLPYHSQYFNHVICCGVLHFLGDLKNLFSEIARIIKTGGIFAFTIFPDLTGDKFTKLMTSWGVPI